MEYMITIMITECRGLLFTEKIVQFRVSNLSLHFLDSLLVSLSHGKNFGLASIFLEKQKNERKRVDPIQWLSEIDYPVTNGISHQRFALNDVTQSMKYNKCNTKNFQTCFFATLTSFADPRMATLNVETNKHIWI